jgi:hypothetical protein
MNANRVLDRSRAELVSSRLSWQIRFGAKTGPSFICLIHFLISFKLILAI